MSDGIAMAVGPLIIEVFDTFHGVGQEFAENLAEWLKGHKA